MITPLLFTMLLLAPPAAAPPEPVKLAAEAVPVPGGEGGIGFDDLGYSPRLGKVLVPSGRTGRLQLVDPKSRKMEEVAGFQASAKGGGGHGEGTTSAEEGKGWIFAIDRTALRLSVIDPKKRAIVAGAPLASSPDYVRYVAATDEVWVTEPDEERIEVFALSAANPPVPEHKASIAVPGGPEALVIDAARGQAYSNLWKGSTVAIDVRKHAVAATWPSGCEGSRGLALAADRGLLFVGCSEGGASALDVAHGGAVKDRLRFGAGVDIVTYDAKRGHLYVPASKTGQMAIVAVSKQGKLALLGTAETAQGSHCAVADGDGQVWVCDPRGGRLLVVRDTLP